MAKKRQITWQQYIAAVIAVITVVAFGGWYYCSQVHLKPENVFWATIDRNLQTGSVTQSIYNASEQQSLSQVTKLQFKAQLASYATVTIQDMTPGNQSTIITEIIGTSTADYLKYGQIESQTSPIPTAAVGVWAKNDASDTQSVDILANELLSTPVIFGYLGHNQRAELIQAMQDNQLFEVDFASVDKSAEFNGKKAYSYKTTINLAAYITVFQTYLNMIGQNELAEQIGGGLYNTQIAVTMIINPISRQLQQITLDDYNATVTFSNYDSNQLIELPTDTPITIDKLQQLLLG
jgi:hypothetical protein